MSLRIVLRWAAAGAPFSWFGFATRFKASREFVGPDFFQRFAHRVHGTIIVSVGSIGGTGADSSRVVAKPDANARC